MKELEERTLRFAIKIRLYLKGLSPNLLIAEDIKQLVRSSGSVGANYLEANEALSKKDFPLHLRISRKEAKESQYWLNFIHQSYSITKTQTTECEKLIEESIELRKILSTIILKSS
jgi:four helix bundle protein